MIKYLKPCLLAVFAMVLCLLVLPNSAQAASASDLTFTLNSDGSSYSVSDCNTAASGDLIIPAVYNGKSVTSIGNNAFYYCRNLSSISIPSSVKSIGVYAFYNCTSLQNIEIPDGVTHLGGFAFSYCNNLQSIRIPDSVTKIGSSVFSGCSNLSSITIPIDDNRLFDTFQYPFGYIFGTSSYTGGIATEQYHFNDRTSTKRYNTYYIPVSLKTVTITGGSIVDGAFYNCTNIQNIIVSESIASIGSNAFYNCSNLKSITISESVTSIGNAAFYNCTGIRTVTIPDSVTDIGGSAFSGCTNLQYITIPGNVKTIGNYAFSSCNSLQRVVLEDGVVHIGNFAFQNCININEIIIPNSVTNIGDQAFSSCSSLTSINLPASVMSIGELPFFFCNNLTAITVDENNPNYSSDSTGILFNKEKTELIQAFSMLSGSYSIPDSVTNIGPGAFYGCDKLTKITIPDGVTIIGANAFQGCTGITSISIPDGVIDIGSLAFFGCTGIKTIKIPNTVTNIGEAVFVNCDSLQSVEIPNSVTSIGYNAFYYCASLTDVYFDGTKEEWSQISVNIGNATIHFLKFATSGTCGMNLTWRVDDTGSTLTVRGNGDMYDYQQDGESPSNSSHPWMHYFATIKKVIIEAGVTKIGNYAFYNCTNLTEISIPNTVLSIGSEAFSFCENLTDITIPHYVTKIGSYAFYNSGLTNLVIPDSVVRIDIGAFRYCENLTSVTIPGSLKSIGTTLFMDCMNLERVTIQNGVTSIGNKAFLFCWNLTNISIPDSVTSIDNEAFSVCSELKTVFYGGTKGQKDRIDIGIENEYLINANWHYEVIDIVYKEQNCYYCPECDNYYLPNGEKLLSTVTFLDWDSSVLSTKVYCLGDEVLAPANPTKAADSTYTYSFAGWDREVVACVGDTTYTAIYTPIYIDYTVVFKNWDGTELSKQIYHWGDEVVAPADPSKATDGIYSYTFTGWDKEITACDGDKVYTATYKSWQFADVSTSSWQINAVVYACNRGLMSGKGTDANGSIIFDPNSHITREEFVQVLYNAENKPSVSIANKFPDVANDGWYKNAVLWANSKNIANGMGNGNFGVGKNITRQDLALMLYKYAAMKNLDLTAPAGEIDQYADGSQVSGYAQTAMNWAVKNGVLSGKGTAGQPLSNFRLDPAGTATRAECAAMLKNFMTAFGL